MIVDRLYTLARAVAFELDPERAHEAAIRALELGIVPHGKAFSHPSLKVNALGLTFANPVGLAAGFDKDARIADSMLGFGFGHVEIGSVTPLPQPGNPRPRLFRLERDRAIINRMGFNSSGHALVEARLAARGTRDGILGVNLGANKTSSDRSADFTTGVERLGAFASYATINVSSPNTPGLRDLQLPGALSALIEKIVAARELLSARTGRRLPLVVKLAPEIAEDDLPEIVRRIVSGGMDGIAIGNTTLARDGLSESVLALEAGGLSGPPLFRRSTRMLARVFQLSGGSIPLIGIGGVDSGPAAAAKIAAGATLLQLYTGMIFEGPGLPDRINRHLAAEIMRRGLVSLDELRGAEANRWAHAAP